MGYPEQFDHTDGLKQQKLDQRENWPPGRKRAR